ncbi:uncharacterized protein LOC116211101 isoform X2 [Punica granatum]|uniref:Uncharacterized protein LOC116211101 isoform X2 n=1 Tax=Punica granatum TaxID=22663 RepID=A0A6P8DUR3_PUNGR|nr:uncharacterized protein LOC116211101 isoform X2 [Punica granatum]XP_031401178.1 uncharacterized protein LOC116211101 isoform X2 [Punica granatum]XP_031401179.1 uncharacterized protein LOC116211101 isoform X2 [Punica granatum]
MVFEGFEPIFGEPKVEWANRGPLPLRRFVYYVHSPDPSHLRIHVSDFHTNTWEAVRSVHQLEDMRDDIGVGDSWSEFIDYFQSSIKSDNVKLVLEGQSGSGAAQAKLVAQKSKGMPLIFIPLMKLMDSDAAEAIGNLSLELLAAFKTTQLLLTQEQNRGLRLAGDPPNEKDKNASIQNKLQSCAKKQKLPDMNAGSTPDVSEPSIRKHKDAATKATNRVVPTHRRARVRGAILQESEDDREG